MSLSNNRNSKFVLVEWDDGNMERTQWYLGHITQYRDHVPSEFQDVGIDAYPNESFQFGSSLMHHYMVCLLSLYTVYSTNTISICHFSHCPQQLSPKQYESK